MGVSRACVAVAACLLCLASLDYTSAANSSPVKMASVLHPAFANAGKHGGLEIWRIENFEPVPVPVDQHGKFFKGDSYIVLFTKEDKKKNTLTWDIHFWLGNQTSQDESGAAAILAVEMDDALGGGPVQHREVQEHESQQFLHYFKNGVRYAPGGVASGFTHVDINAPTEKILYQVKGKRNIRVREVQINASSMNKGDCFILDTGREILVYVGPKAKGTERLKAISAANQIKSQDHAGRGAISIIDTTSSPDEVAKFFSALGSGSANQIADEAAGGEDQEFERNQEAIVVLHKVTDASGKVVTEKIAQKPLLQSMLKSDDAFILDTANAGIYIWVGKKSTTQEKVEALKKGQAYIASKNYPSWTHLRRVIEGAEPSAFREYFSDWSDRLFIGPGKGGSSPTPSRRSRSVYQAGTAETFMPDEADGNVEIFRIENFEMVPIDPATYGMFFGGDSYVIKYTYTKGHQQKYIIYFWQGKDSTQDEKAASAINALRLDNELGGKAVQVRVSQGYEPRHFLKLFKGKMIIFMGGRASGFRNLRDHDTYDIDGTRLFQVRGTNAYDVRAIQVPEVASSLNSNDAFVLETPSTTYLWIGVGCSPEEEEMAAAACGFVSPDRSVVTMSEGAETAEFWNALGGRGAYHSQAEELSPLLPRAPKLFHCFSLSGDKLKVEEIPHFAQEDLLEDDVMVLDSGEEVYVWLGSRSTLEEKRLTMRMAEEYLDRESSGRSPSSAVIVVVNQGTEPESFSSLFPEWEEDFWLNVPSYNDIKEQVAISNAAAKFE